MKSILQSKKFIIISAIVACFCGGIFMIESKAGDEIAHRIEEQLTLIGATYESVEVSPVGQSVEIIGLAYISEQENAIIDIYAEKIILDSISFDALDLDAGDYPLVAETIDLINLKFSYKDPYNKLDMDITQYHITNWCQNIALLIEATEHGYASVEFLERAYTYKFDKYEMGALTSTITYEDYTNSGYAEIALDSAISSWANNDVISSTMYNFNINLENMAQESISCLVEETNMQMQTYKIFSPKALAMLTHLSLTNYNDSMLEEEILLDILAEEKIQENLDKINFSMKNFSISYNEENIINTALISSVSHADMQNFILNVEDLNFTTNFYEYFAEEFYALLLDMKLKDTNLDYELEISLLEDNTSINIKQNIAIDDIFVFDIAATIEMLYPLETAIEENTPNKLNEIYVSYEDKGFLPRTNLAIQSLFDIDMNRALAIQKESVNSFALFIPDLSTALDKLFQDLGKIEINLNESIGIFDLLFIPPTSLNNLFTVKYQPSNQTLAKAIKKL